MQPSIPASQQQYLPSPSGGERFRDVYDLRTKPLLIVATDRISAFDCIMPNGIPDKGRKLLTGAEPLLVRKVWRVGDFPNHLIATKVEKYPGGIA